MNEVLNILTRATRPDYFQVLKQTVYQQTNRDFNWIVGCDNGLIKDGIELKLGDLEYPQPQPSTYPALWNKHLETLAEYCQEGYLMYLDCDDRFASQESVQTIVDNVEEDRLLIWRVQITPEFIVPRLEDFGKVIAAGNISGIGIAFHTKHLPVKWSTWSYGDFRVVRQLVQEKGLQPKFLNQILTLTQDGDHHGII